jgi:hypothetical protein
MANTELFDLLGKYTGPFVLLFVTPALGAYLGAYLKKKGENLATHEDIDKLVSQVSAVTAASKQIEARITRASRVHERQVDTLVKLYRHFFDAQGYLQRMASPARFEGERSVDEYRPLFAETMASARDTLTGGRLLIPPDLTEQCDRFFNSLFQGQAHLTFALHPMIVDGLQRAEFWKKAQQTAYEEVPKILQQIERAARDVIHGENVKPT